MNCSSIRGFMCLIRKLDHLLDYLLLVIKYCGNEVSNCGNLFEGDHVLPAGSGNWGLSDRGSDLRCQLVLG